MTSVPMTEPAPFVGRTQELAWLRACLDEAVSGQPRLVLIEGDAGVGKSRLVRQFQREAASRGIDVSTGRCREHADLPYLPFTGSLLVRLEEVALHDDELTPYAGVITRVLGKLPGDGDPRPEREQAWLFLAVTQTTVALARRRPQVLLLDDVQWADGPSLDLFAHLVLESGDLGLREPVPLLVIATHRPEPDGTSRAVLARLRREELTRTLRVTGLGEGETDALIRALGVDSASRRLLQRVHAATRGNPLFVEYVVRSVLVRAAARGGEAAEITDADLAVPEEVSTAVAGQIATVGPDCRAILVAASYAGDPVRLDVLATATGRTPTEIEAGLLEAENAGLVTRDGEQVAIAQPLAAHLLHDQPEPGERRSLHARVASALIEANGAPIEIAAHLVKAGSAARAATVREWCERGGEESWRASAWDDAARAFDASAQAADALDDDAGAAALLVRAGAAHYRNMDPQLSAARFDAAIDHFRRLGDLPGVARALMEQIHARLVGASFGTVVDTSALEEVGTELDDAGLGFQARVRAQLAETRWVAGRIDEARELAGHALDDARAEGAHDALARTQVTLAVIEWMGLELAGAETHLQEALAAARASGDPWLEGLVLPRLALTRLWRGNLDGANEAAELACANAERTQDLAEHSLALAALVGIAVTRGEWDEAERLGERAWMSLRLAQYWWASSFVAGALVSMRSRRGDRAGALEVIDRWQRALPESDAARVFVAFARDVAAGDPPSVAEFPPGLPVGIGVVQCLAAVATEGDPASDGTLARLATGLAFAEDNGMVVTEGLVYLVPRARGVAAARAGRVAEAER
ncbi:MAG: ATP-binding protein, partial [Acidimicrobiia bacterium]